MLGNTGVKLREAGKKALAQAVLAQKKQREKELKNHNKKIEKILAPDPNPDNNAKAKAQIARIKAEEKAKAEEERRRKKKTEEKKR